MNVKVNTIGGGIFSKFMIGIQSLRGHQPNNVDNIYMDINWSNVDGSRQKKVDGNPFDFVLEQDKSLKYNNIQGTPSTLHTQMVQTKDITQFYNFKKFVRKLKIKDDILNRVNPLIDEDTLGVHIRLTDMNTLHPNLGVLTTDHYKKKIESVLRESGKTKIFISSDNMESVNILKKDFDVTYNDVSNRSESENGEGYNKYLRENSGDKKLWEDSFLDMISLSKCGELIYTASNFSIASILFSDTIKKAHKL